MAARISFRTQDPRVKELLSKAERIAAYPTTVLISGESGTGKELLARLIHQLSPRAEKPFVAVNCGAIPEGLMESELFGHIAGAFTDAQKDKPGLFEQAQGGTIFLDEVAEVSSTLQPKLLRVLQERTVRRVGDNKEIIIDTRVIAATLRSLENEVKAQRFREDLFFRLNVVNLHIPALRERLVDIAFLAEEICTRLNKKVNLSVKGCTPETLACLQRYSWPGNVRELENCLERAIVLSDADYIKPEDLPDVVRSPGLSDVPVLSTLGSEDDLSLKKAIHTLEVHYIQRALKKTKGNRTHAARILEISHRALLYKIKEYGLD